MWLYLPPAGLILRPALPGGVPQVAASRAKLATPVEGGLLFPIQAQAPGLALTGLFGTRAHP